jgi:hypothetical protein
MLRRVRSRLTYSNVVASMALFVALGGVSYAAATLPKNSVGSSQIKKNAVTAAKVKDRSLTGADIKNKSLTAADFNGSVGGPAGPQGPKGDAGATGATGARGASGQDLTSTSTLASGQTLTGVFIAAGGDATNGLASSSWQFHPRLPENLDSSHAKFQAPATSSTNCPGIDQAAAGYLCVYATQLNNMTFNSFNNSSATPGVSRLGALVFFSITGAGSYTSGRWAVTAP